MIDQPSQRMRNVAGIRRNREKRGNQHGRIQKYGTSDWDISVRQRCRNWANTQSEYDSEAPQRRSVRAAPWPKSLGRYPDDRTRIRPRNLSTEYTWTGLTSKKAGTGTNMTDE